MMTKSFDVGGGRRPGQRKPGLLAALTLTLLSLGVELHAEDAATVDDFLDLSLQDLLSMEVTSVSKRLQQIKDAAAAIFVITRDDIRRSGVTSIPEALRMAPGIQVGRVNANKWAVSARGFNSQWANKLLVLIDGRSVYVPSYAGVYWEMQDYILDDIERIEVIRGPGATLWGSNAVNGIINIITRSAADTQGGLVSVAAGNERQGQTELRYGTALGDAASGRAYLKYQQTDSFHQFPNGSDAADDWESMQAGFRVDGEYGSNDWTLQGDIFDLDASQFVALLAQPVPPFNSPQADPYNAGGWNLLGRVAHAWNEDAHSTLQIYYDHNQRKEITLAQSYDTLDIDFQHEVKIGTRHHLIAGLGYRRIEDEFRNSFTFSANPDSFGQNLYSAFAQDEITLFPEHLTLTLGAKFEHNDYTGLEVQPSARLLWTIDASHTLWTAVSRAVRIPSRVEVHGRIVTAVMPVAPPPAPPLEFSINGNPGQDAEELLAYELGYRLQAAGAFSLDIAAFYNDYDELQNFGITVPPATLTFGNALSADSFGIEIAADWRPRDWWRLQPNYTYQRIFARIAPGVADRISEQLREGSTPHHQVSIRSAMDFGRDVDFDVWVYHVTRLRDQGAVVPLDVPAYTSVNLRLAWRPVNGVELSVSGHNLLEPRNLEFVGESYLGVAEVDRSVLGQLRWEW